MKKYFMFAAVAAAGLFASCSSDDNIASENAPVVPIEEGTDPMPIKLNVAQYGTVSRGTGTVGGVVKIDNTDPNNPVTTAVNNDGSAGGATNVWQGQKVNVFMFKTFDTRTNSPLTTLQIAQFENPEGTLSDIYNDAVLTTPKNAAYGTASYLTGNTAGTNQDLDGGAINTDDPTRYVKYFPMTDRFDFWGYRIDDAANKTLAWMKAGATAQDPDVPATVNNNVPEDATKLNVSFDIDGTQDVLAAVTDVRTYTTTPFAFADQDTYDAAVAAKYSASSARKGLDPELKFAHKLTRLTFQGAAGDNESQSVFVRGIRVRPLKAIDAQSGDSTWYSKEGVTLTIADINAPTAQPVKFNELVTNTQDWATNKPKTEFTLMKRADGDTDGNQDLVDLFNQTAFDASAKDAAALATNGAVAMTGTYTAAAAAHTDAVEEASSTNYDNAEAENKSEGDAAALDAYTIQTNDGKYFHNTTDGKYYKIVYTAATGATRNWANIGESIILPPSESYEVEILLAQVNTTVETVNGNPITRETIQYKTLKNVVRAGANPDPFQPSFTYNFRIIVYGLQRIDIQTTLQPWEFGENVDVDTDN